MNGWLQQKDKPLFPDLLWSKPETKRGAGKLLIIGGQMGNFAQVASSYAAAEKAGAGIIRVIMPESTKRATQFLPNIEYAHSNQSGSFAKPALGSFFEASSWADHVLLAGDFGKNSETATLLDGYLLRNPVNVTLADDVLRSIQIPYPQLMQKKLTLVLNMRSLQNLGVEMSLREAFVSTISLPLLAKNLKQLSENQKTSVVTEHSGNLWVANNGRAAATPFKQKVQISVLAAYASVWTMQNPSKNFEALVTACYETATF